MVHDPSKEEIDCPWCSTFVQAAVRGKYEAYLDYGDDDDPVRVTAKLLECIRCHRPVLSSQTWSDPSYGDGYNYQDLFLPSSVVGSEIKHLPDAVHGAWREVVASIEAGAPTAANHMCRKLLSYLAVDRCGSKPNRRFVQYIDDLVNSGEITQSLKPALTLIKDQGNTAAHELDPSSSTDALRTATITAAVLRVLYEIPAEVKS